MAIGAVVSHRNFGSFIGSERLYHGETATYHQPGQRLSVAAAKYACPMIRSKLYLPCTSYTCARGYSSSLHTRDQSNAEFHQSNYASHLRVDPPLLTSHQLSRKFKVINTRRRVRGLCQCCLTSAYSDSNLIPARKFSNRSFLDSQNPMSKYSTVMGTTADFTSEDFDITGTNLDSILSPDGASEAVLVKEVEQAVPWWKQLPKRWVMVLLCFTAFLLCNMDRVNMSIAILPMSKEYNWNSATVGLIQSSFFWGYLLTQIVGGIWADKIGGKLVLGFGVIWWSIATVLTPIAARIGLPCLLIMRAFMGIGEGVAMPAMNNLLSKWIPVSERSRSLALVYSGMYLGSVTGLAVSPVMIQKFGWPSIFYSFGSLGIIWFALWWSKAHSSPEDDPDLSLGERELILGGSISKEPVLEIPWKKILTKAPVWALIVSHFCHNWGTFILLTWMPTYYNQVLKFNLTKSGLLCVLPWLTMAVFANIGGWIADTLISKGLSITTVRKIMQSIGFLGPAFFLTQLSKVKTPALAVLCMACSQGSDAFSQSGLYSNHQDIGPRYAGVLLGLSNTAGVLAGVFGTAATGYILQKGTTKPITLISAKTIIFHFRQL
ncbi:ascorbate transporter, chloroplastic-like isoform X2 [Salvia miltiorrhiza]|uniref:ascorbate transporter, chloroplastic-like isoform X2 n=1 Tax=Salvia miltiorrhiza TaxID=226208 RepID=UPI0025AC9A73|nr:ascorbate transporter, chloroplastic-like isoform X2 [Salvia miltiorrhiza]